MCCLQPTSRRHRLCEGSGCQGGVHNESPQMQIASSASPVARFHSVRNDLSTLSDLELRIDFKSNSNFANCATSPGLCLLINLWRLCCVWQASVPKAQRCACMPLIVLYLRNLRPLKVKQAFIKVIKSRAAIEAVACIKLLPQCATSTNHSCVETKNALIS